MAMTPETMTEELKRLYPGILRSVLLFGSAASGEASSRYSDFNLLVVLDRLGLEELRLAADPVGRWVKEGNPPPLLFTFERLQRSEDVFPIEFLDMRDRHRVLHGEDPFESLTVHDSNLRHELEHELKGKLLKLRQSYILTGGRAKAVQDLIARSGSTFAVLFQAALRLFGEGKIPSKAEAPRRLAERVGFDAEVFDYVEGLRAGREDALAESPDERFQALLEAVEKAADAVDRWTPAS